MVANIVTKQLLHPHRLILSLLAVPLGSGCRCLEIILPDGQTLEMAGQNHPFPTRQANSYEKIWRKYEKNPKLWPCSPKKLQLSHRICPKISHLPPVPVASAGPPRRCPSPSPERSPRRAPRHSPPGRRADSAPPAAPDLGRSVELSGSVGIFFFQQILNGFFQLFRILNGCSGFFGWFLEKKHGGWTSKKTGIDLRKRGCLCKRYFEWW